MKQLWRYAVVVVMLSVGLSVQAVSAHATLVASDAPMDSIIPTAPEALQLTFDMELNTDLSSMQVAGPDGTVIAEGGADLDDPDRASMVANLEDELPAGEYVVSWIVVEVDEDETHEVEGQYTFTIDPSATPAAASTVAIAAPQGTMAPVDDASEVTDDDSGGIGRGPLIVGGVTVLIALAVVATVGRRRLWR